MKGTSASTAFISAVALLLTVAFVSCTDIQPALAPTTAPTHVSSDAATPVAAPSAADVCGEGWEFDEWREVKSYYSSESCGVGGVGGTRRHCTAEGLLEVEWSGEAEPCSSPAAKVAATPEATIAPSVAVDRTASFESSTLPTAPPTVTPVPAAAPEPAATRGSSYLEATVQPCLGVKSGVDPCDGVGRNESIDAPAEASFAGWTAVTIEDDMIGRSVNERFGYSHVPHFVVRGTYEPGSTRCAVTGIGTPLSYVISEEDHEWLAVIATAEAKYEADPDALKELPSRYPPTLITCVTDLAVHEYMAGRGPATLTLVTFSRAAFLYISDFYERHEADPDYDFGYDLWVMDFAEGVAEPIEGKEKVIWVGTPSNLAVKAWRPVQTWDLTREGSDIVVARHDAWHHINSPDDYALIVHSLDEYRDKVKDAHSKLVETHDGRMGDHEDLPMLVLDANDEFLEELFVAEGAYKFNKTPLSITVPDPDFQYPTPTPFPPPPSPTPSPVFLPVVDLEARVVQKDDGLAVELSWVQPEDDNIVTRYVVFREEIHAPDGGLLLGGGVGSVHEPTAPETRFVDDLLLEPGSTYTYHVRTYGINFNSVESDVVTITIPSE